MYPADGLGKAIILIKTHFYNQQRGQAFCLAPYDRNVFQRFTASINFKNAVLPHSVRLYTPASSRT